MNLNCIIIEDEPLAAEKLKGYILKSKDFTVKAVFDNPKKAAFMLKNNSIELLFLDINLKEMSGVEFIESIDFQGKVIITTAYDEYALKAYELDVIDYLLKPFTYERFMQAIEKFKNQLSIETQRHYFFLKTEHRYDKVSYDELLYIKGMGDYRQVVCTNRKIMTLETFHEFERHLPPSKVVRIHKSFMVCLSKIDSIETNKVTIANTTIPISKTYKDRFFNTLK